METAYVLFLNICACVCFLHVAMIKIVQNYHSIRFTESIHSDCMDMNE